MSTKSGLAVMTKLMPSYKRVMQRAQFPLGRCTTQNYVKRFHQNNLCRTTIIKNPTNRLEYSVSLYTALKICQGISTTIVPNKKTVISLELQLYYIKAIQLRDHDQVGNDFFFRVGELHVVFAMCHAIGKYIDSSGLDKLFTQSGIYGHLAVNKILARGKI